MCVYMYISKYDWFGPYNLFICMFSWLNSGHWTTNWRVLPSLLSSVACNSSHRVEALLAFAICFGMSIFDIFVHLKCKQPCWWDTACIAFDITRRHTLTQSSLIFYPWQPFCFSSAMFPYPLVWVYFVDVSTVTGPHNPAFWLVVIFPNTVCRKR